MRTAVCKYFAIDPALIRTGRRTAGASRAREAVVGLVVQELGRSHTEAARVTGVSRQAIEKALSRFAAWPEDRRAAILRLLPDFPD